MQMRLVTKYYYFLKVYAYSSRLRDTTFTSTWSLALATLTNFWEHLTIDKYTYKIIDSSTNIAYQIHILNIDYTLRGPLSR